MAGELVLIVEDNEKNRKLERDILQFHGYRTMEAETAEDGLRLAQAKPPALVLMDIQLPGMNGIEALQHLRADARTRAIPVIAVTASVMDQDRRKILAAGFDGYQAKPIEVTQFVAAVRQAVDGPASSTRAGTTGTP
jgi:two-component system cell cycle response regulator DivK